MAFWNSYEGELHAFRAVFRRHRFGAISYVTKKGFPQMSFSKKIIAGVAAVATLAALAPAVAMAEGDAPATQQQTQNEVKIFNVMVHANGGTFTSGNNTGQAGDYMVTVQDGGSLVSALPQVQRDGYLFAGWSYDKDGKSPVVATDFVSANTEVYAQWTKQKPVVDAKQFNVTVSTNGGTIADGDHKGEAGDIQVSAAQDSVLVNALPQVQRDGYLFAGWSYDKDGKSPVVATDFVSANTEVYAQWTKQKPVVDAKQFNVTVSTNGGTIADGDHKGEAGDIQVSAAQDSVLVNALPTVTREGYTFAGWSYDKDGNSKVLDTDFVSANTFVYAQWTKADDSKKDDSKPADTTKKNDTKGNTKKTVAQKIKKAVLGNTGATVGGVAAFAVLALLGFAGITVLRKRA